MFKSVWTVSLLLIMGAGALIGCSERGDVAATVNGQVITAQQVDTRMAQLSPSVRAALKNDPKRLLQEMVTESILMQEARTRGLNRDSDVQRLVEEARKQIMLGRLLEVMREEAAIEVTDQEVVQAYQANQDQFKEPERLRASHILVPTEAKAKEALGRIKEGEEFALVAQSVSKDPTAVQGGDIGYFSAGQLIPEFEAVCNKLQPGEVSSPLKTELGYHVIVLTERRAARVKPLVEVQETIRTQIAQRKRQRVVEQSIQAMRSSAQISVEGEYELAVASDTSGFPSVGSSEQ